MVEGMIVLVIIIDQNGNILIQEVLIGFDGIFIVIFDVFFGFVDGLFMVSVFVIGLDGMELFDVEDGLFDLIVGDLIVVVDVVDNNFQIINFLGIISDVIFGGVVNLIIVDIVGNMVIVEVIVNDDGIFFFEGIDVFDLVDGLFFVFFSVMDCNGNQLISEVFVGVVLDVVDGSVSVVVDSVDNENFIIDILGFFNDVVFGEIVVLIIIDLDGNVVEIRGMVDDDGSYSVDGVDLIIIDGIDLVDGLLMVNVIVFDRNGNSVEVNDFVIVNFDV